MRQLTIASVTTIAVLVGALSPVATHVARPNGRRESGFVPGAQLLQSSNQFGDATRFITGWVKGAHCNVRV